MKALSLRQPWAYAVTHLGKRLENRVWKWLRSGLTRGDTIALHASKTKPEDYDTAGVIQSAEYLDAILPEAAYTKSVIVGTAKICAVLRTTEPPTYDVDDTQDHPFPHFVMRDDDHAWFLGCGASPEEQREQLRRWWLGPYAFWFDEVMVFAEPVTCGGSLGFWEIPVDVMTLVEAQIAKAVPAEHPNWHRRSLAIATAHDTVVSIQPALPPPTNTLTMRQNQSTVPITNKEKAQMTLFEDPSPKKRGGLH